VQGPVPTELQECERRAVAPRGLEHKIALEEACSGVQVAGKLGGQRTGAADDGARGGGDRDGHAQNPASSGVTRSTIICTWSPVSDV